MIRVALLAIASALVALYAIATAGGGQSATKPVASYCSGTGDLCLGVIRKDGALYMEITTFAQYFVRYSLCVKPPTGATTCRSFPIRRRGQLYESSVLWHRNYPNRGPGAYRVTWKLQQPLGPTLTFRLK